MPGMINSCIPVGFSVKRLSFRAVLWSPSFEEPALKKDIGNCSLENFIRQCYLIKAVGDKS